MPADFFASEKDDPQISPLLTKITHLLPVLVMGLLWQAFCARRFAMPALWRLQF